MSQPVDVIEAAERDSRKPPSAFGGAPDQAEALLAHVGKLIARCREADSETRTLAAAVVLWLAEPGDAQKQQEAARAIAKATGGNAGDFLRQIQALIKHRGT